MHLFVIAALQAAADSSAARAPTLGAWLTL
jgi:hypothetical protein